MRRVVYFSKSLTGMTQDDIAAILDVSRDRNAHVGITGLLLHINGVFAQVLEGMAVDVQAVLDRITRDPRHQDIVILSDRETETPVFTDWSMAYVDTDVSELLAMAGPEGVEEAMAAFSTATGDAPPALIDHALKEFSRRLGGSAGYC